MSIENIQQMIKDAPEASVWWAVHHTQLVRFNTLRNGAAGSVILGSPIIIMCMLLVNANVNIIRDVGIGCFAALVLAVGLTETTFWILRKYRKGFNRLHVKWQERALLPATMEQKTKTLAALLRVQNPQIQRMSEDLLALREHPLPDAWWHALENHFNGIAKQENTPLVVQTQQQFDDVCVELQRRSKGEMKPKVLKI